MKTNCPNCGAPIKHLYNHNCEYCGTFLKDEPTKQKNYEFDFKRLDNYDLHFKEAHLERSPWEHAHVLTVICEAFPKFREYGEYDNNGSLYVTLDSDIVKNNRIGISIKFETMVYHRLQDYFSKGETHEIVEIIRNHLPIPFHAALPDILHFLREYFYKEI